ncbi:MAG TPA: translation initiation factor IF-2 subunit beta [Candidatus Bathyarchaeota archaeon]|nr:translation initiation factor IF-2 subunit beta [Candidatus Bathyarchaeota archaeon]HEX69307.1 translation initiation factor IF-2 subunit beta [Candidatus Bathyarchaeota archaeon]
MESPNLDEKYEELLERAYSQLPPTIFESKRFEIPRVRSTIFGMRTIVHNFKEIAETLNRPPQHLLKFLAKEMATAGVIDDERAIFQGKFENETLQHLVERYTKEYVICPICKRPDTKIVKEKRLWFLVCEACGAKSSIRPV